MTFYSVRTRRALAENTRDLPLGAAHYSYGSVCEKFLNLFDYCAIYVQELLRPEIYPHYSFVPSLAETSGRPNHIIFKAYEEIRILKGANNIAHVAWEFEQLPSFSSYPIGHPARNNLLNDYMHMLRICNEVWVGCSFTKSVLEKSGLENVHVVPAPIRKRAPFIRNASTKKLALDGLANIRAVPLCSGSRHQGFERATLRDAVVGPDGQLRDIFISMLNPGDMRKNIPAILKSFSRFSSTRPGATLIIKVIIDNIHVKITDVLSDIIPKRFAEVECEFDQVRGKDIFIVHNFLNQVEMTHLYQLADFYICASFAEGQNLPLQEAMAMGVVPVSPATTAMADYISHESAIVVETERTPLFHQASLVYGLTNCRWDSVILDKLEEALQRAASLSPQERAEKSAAARDAVERVCGFDRIGKLVERRLSAAS